MYGLGTLYKTDGSTGQIIDCDAWGNIFQTACWNPFQPATPVYSTPPVSSGDSSGGSPSAVQPVQSIPSSSSDGGLSLSLSNTTLLFGGLGLFALMFLMGRR